MNDEMYYWTKDLIIDPTDNTQNTWYAAVHSGWGGNANDKGGLYKTTDRGTTWQRIFDSYRVESATINPQNADEMYVTTESEGLWYTSDATNASPTFTQLMAYDFQHPMRVFFNPQDVNEVWITSFGNGLKMGMTTGTNGLSEINTASPLHVYPNPVQHELHIASENMLVSWTLVDQLGQTVLEGKAINATQSTLRTDALKPGSYLLKTIDSNGRSATEKIMIVRD